MNRDEIQGKARAAKGSIKQAAAEITDDPNLYDEGTADKAAGRTQESVGRVRRKAGEVVEKVGKAIKK
jgi:uncharacterized protein YjbJ (UPF0337 family)